MTKIYYITHPSVEIDKSKNPDEWKLSEEGKEKAKELLRKHFWAEVDIIFSSEEPKAKEVAKMASEKFGIETFSYKDLGEADRSATPFLPLEEYMEKIEEAYEKPSKSIVGWESHESVMKRNVNCLKGIVKKYKNKTIAIIGHGGAGTLIKCFIKGKEPDFDEDPKKTGCFFVADWESRKVLNDWKGY